MEVRVLLSRPIHGKLSGWDPSWFAKPRAPNGVRIVLSAFRQFAGVTSVVEALPSKQNTGVRFSVPAPIMPRSSTGYDRCFSHSRKRVETATGCQLAGSFNGRTWDFESHYEGSIPSPAANTAVVRWCTVVPHKDHAGGSSPPTATILLAMLDGNERRDCESRG